MRDILSYAQMRRRGCYSQHGEDLFLLKYFKDVSIGRYVDIGASHPFRLSNTYSLYRIGWAGVCVDPIRSQIEKHKRFRPRDLQLNIGVSDRATVQRFYEFTPSVLSTFDENVAKARQAEGWTLVSDYDVSTRSLMQILAETSSMSADLLSVDVEGYDFQVLQSNDWERFRPKIVIYEQNDSSDVRSQNLLTKSGYSKLITIGCNAVFERNV